MPPDESAAPVSRDLLNTAAGVLMARHHLGAHEAYGLVMDTARRTGRTVAAVVDQVIREAQGKHGTDPGRGA